MKAAFITNVKNRKGVYNQQLISIQKEVDQLSTKSELTEIESNRLQAHKTTIIFLQGMIAGLDVALQLNKNTVT